MVAGLVAAGVDVREVVVDMDGRIKIIAGRPGPLGGCLVSRLDDPYPAELGELLRST
jgi:hypothetical protein